MDVTKNKYPNGVAAALERAGVEQAEFARLLGESRQQVGRWVHGERKLTFAMALKMSQVLGVTPESLFTPPGMTEILKAEELADHKSAAEKDREAREAMIARFREFSDQTLARFVSEAVSEMQSRVSKSAQPAEKRKRTPPGSSPKSGS